MSQAMSGGSMAMGGPGGPPPGAEPGSMGPMGMMGEQAPQEQQPPPPATESDFEQSFFDIALVYLRDKAPMLMEHLLGFEILEHDEEDERAAGVFGFKLGDQELYAPVFFINGELKGYELLYIKGDDLFVPLQENWVNYLMNRRPHILGDATEESDRSVSRVQPDFRPFWDTPMRNKYASMLQPPKVSGNLDMEKVAGSMPAYVSQILLEMKANPRLAEGIFTYYPPERFEKIAAKTIGLQEGNRVSEKGRVTYQDVEIISGTDDKRDLLLSNKDRESLAAGNIVVRDHRIGANISKYVPAVGHHRMCTPDKTGFYDVLVKGCKKKRLFALCHPIPIGRGHSRYTVLADTSTGAHSNVFNTDVYASEYHQRDWDKFFKSLPKQNSIVTGGTYILVSRDGKGTVPFRVKEKIKRSDGTTVLQVRTDQSLSPSETRDTHLHTNKTTSDDQRYIIADEQTAVGSKREARSSETWFTSLSERVIHLNGCPGNGHMRVGTALVIPAGFKVIKLSEAGLNSISSEPGTLVDLDMGLEGVAPRIKLHYGGSEFRLYTKDNDKPEPVLAKSAVINLIRVHGLSEKESRFIVKEAQVKGQLRFRIKYAPGYPLTKQGLVNRVPSLQQNTGIQLPNLPPVEGTTAFNSTLGVMEHIPQVRTIPGTLPANARQDRRISPLLSPYDIRTLSEAQSTGQKEVFDTAMLGSLLKSMQPIEMVDKYLSDLMRGLDRVGRILFLFYWHGEDFKARYGTEELSELESSLKNVFKGIGELVLYLKQRSVEEFNERDEVNLAAVQ